VGLLDNIISAHEPSYELYRRLGWKPLPSIWRGPYGRVCHIHDLYPDSVRSSHLRQHLTRILFSLKRKRAVIDMHDNEDMVRRTIEEFQSICGALVELFRDELASGTSPPLLRFMFTRLTTKLDRVPSAHQHVIGYTVENHWNNLPSRTMF